MNGLGPMARRLPPLNGLKAFEAAARSESFTRAAEELNVTQSAVSHQVKALEDKLGLKLFHRERQRLILTKAADFLKFPLLRLEDAKNWTRLFEAAGVKATIGPGPVLNGASMSIDAAIDGQGIALARTALAAWDLIKGRLVRPVDVSLRMANTYWIVCPKAGSTVPKIARFR